MGLMLFATGVVFGMLLGFLGVYLYLSFKDRPKKKHGFKDADCRSLNADRSILESGRTDKSATEFL